MQADAATLHKNLRIKNVMYQHNHARPMGVSAVAQLLANTLYYKRFFPYYTFNLVAGLDADGGWAGVIERGEGM
jgi:20S proteasome subunit beta 6